jgi:hypothetical protein
MGGRDARLPSARHDIVPPASPCPRLMLSTIRASIPGTTGAVK